MVIEQRQNTLDLECINARSGSICVYICTSEQILSDIHVNYIHNVSILSCFLLPVSQSPTIKGKSLTGFSSPRIPETWCNMFLEFLVVTPSCIAVISQFFFSFQIGTNLPKCRLASPPHGKPVITHQKRCKHAAERARTQRSCIQTVAPSQLTLPQRGIAFMGLWKSHKWCHISIYTYIMYIVNIMCFGMILVWCNNQTVSGFSNYSSSTRTLILYTVLHNHPSACAHYDF